MRQPRTPACTPPGCPLCRRRNVQAGRRNTVWRLWWSLRWILWPDARLVRRGRKQQGFLPHFYARPSPAWPRAHAARIGVFRSPAPRSGRAPRCGSGCRASTSVRSSERWRSARKAQSSCCFLPVNAQSLIWTVCSIIDECQFWTV